MDKIILDEKDLLFIGEWLPKTGNTIEYVPRVLDHFILEYTTDQSSRPDRLAMRAEVKFIQDEQVDIVALFFRPDKTTRLHWYTHFDYRLTTLRKAIREGKTPWTDIDTACDEYFRDKDDYIAFLMGFASAPDKAFVYEKHKEQANIVSQMIIYTLYFLANFESELVEYITDEVTVAPKKSSKKKSSKSRAVHTTTIRLQKYIKDVESGVKKLPRHYKKCNYSYSVRGHWRTYKSGKKVWIKSYTKNTLEHKRKRAQKSKVYKFDLKE